MVGKTDGWVLSKPATGAATKPHMGSLPSRQSSTRLPFLSWYQDGKPYWLLTGPAAVRPPGLVLTTAVVAKAPVVIPSGTATTVAVARMRRDQTRRPEGCGDRAAVPGGAVAPFPWWPPPVTGRVLVMRFSAVLRDSDRSNGVPNRPSPWRHANDSRFEGGNLPPVQE